MRQIKRVAVLGAGVMGATIAAHCANAGLEVLLFDRVPGELTAEESARGLTLDDSSVRNRFAAQGLAAALKGRPAPFYLPEYGGLIRPGNLDDDLGALPTCDWVIEVVVENLEIKQALFRDKVAPHLAPGAILSSNTSGLSVEALAEALPPSVRRNFLVTHFFNPPRYMRLLEVIPCSETDPAVVEELGEFIGHRLGKGVVRGKDTPNFIANRIGVYALFCAMRHMTELKLSVEEVDAVSGPATARPKSAVFRTADLVGLDTLAHVGENSRRLLVDDEEREIFRVPDFLQGLIASGHLGNKSGSGFYRREKGATLVYDPGAGDYRPRVEPPFPSLAVARGISDPAERLQAVLAGSDPGAEFAWRTLRDTLIYTVRRIPEIADDIVSVDNGMKWGFNWELGPFEILDAIGVAAFIARAETDGVDVPEVLRKVKSFYRQEAAALAGYDFASGSHRPLPVSADRLRLDLLRKGGALRESNAAASLLDLGDGVLCLEFHSKMNTIGSETLELTRRAVERAEAEGVGLVIANQGTVFSAGADLSLIASLSEKKDFAAIDDMVRRFQEATGALKYAAVPVVAAPFNLTLGGGAEFVLHASGVAAHAETYMGLVEVGAGLLPAGGGTKELALRAVRLAEESGCDVSPYIIKAFEQIGMARVSTAAAELFGFGYLQPGDTVTMDASRLLADAKARVLVLARCYRPRHPQQVIAAPGRSLGATLKSRLWNLQEGGFITPYDAVVGGAVAEVLTGGDVSTGTLLSEDYFLELEREAFLRLCGNLQTAERIAHLLKSGKPLRN